MAYQNKVHLTFDIDWAPDWVVFNILDELRTYNIQATFFITHPSDTIETMKSDGHNIGLHPNFFPNSSHGKTPEEVMDYISQLHPNAVSIRTHGLVQSSPLLQTVVNINDRIKYDFSTFTYLMPHISCFNWNFYGNNLKRINYNWEDDAAFFDANNDWTTITPFANLHVFDFHPIHIALNSKDYANYTKLKNTLGSRSLTNATPCDLEGAANHEDGTNSRFQALLKGPWEFLTFDQLIQELTGDDT